MEYTQKEKRFKRTTKIEKQLSKQAQHTQYYLGKAELLKEILDRLEDDKASSLCDDLIENIASTHKQTADALDRSKMIKESVIIMLSSMANVEKNFEEDILSDLIERGGDREGVLEELDILLREYEKLLESIEQYVYRYQSSKDEDLENERLYINLLCDMIEISVENAGSVSNSRKYLRELDDCLDEIDIRNENVQTLQTELQQNIDILESTAVTDEIGEERKRQIEDLVHRIKRGFQRNK